MVENIARWSVVFFAFIAPLWSADERDTEKAKAKPLPEVKVTVDQEIRNPFFPKPVWKLWARDSSPVTLDSTPLKGTFAPPPREERRFPVFEEDRRGAPHLKPIEGSPEIAGFWDDGYMSLDNGHSGLNQPRKQFIRCGKMHRAGPPAAWFLLGANFTSQSYARRGRHLVDDTQNLLFTEKFFYFANCVRATPAVGCLRDTKSEAVEDKYDSLFGHAYQSVGQSSSEVHALYKMMIAGGCMSRKMKDLLKLHGNYAMTLLTIFKAALPYADANGKELPYEHEMRHRPAYSSSGSIGHPHFCSANPVYHGYDDNRHIENMVELARKLEVAPPVTLMHYVAMKVTKDGKFVPTKRENDRVKSISLTNLRVWGNPGESITVIINLGKSYSLKDRPLSYSCKTLYENQKNVTIASKGKGVFIITAKHDPKLPKGRIPVIATTRNGSNVPGNPVFINFYWPDPNERFDYTEYSLKAIKDEAMRKKLQSLVEHPVTRNKRPTMELGVDGDAIRCKPGETIRFPISTSDPEGYSTTIYRRSGESGAIKDDIFTMKVPETPANKIIKTHFVVSDGTGGYFGKRMEFLVSEDADTLPEPWKVTVIGSPQAGSVQLDEKAVGFARFPLERSRRPEGIFVYRQASGNTDLVCEAAGGEANMGVMIRKSLYGFSRFGFCGVHRNQFVGQLKGGESSWGTRTEESDPELKVEPKFYRLSCRDGWLSAYASADRKTWELVNSIEFSPGRPYFAGFFYSGGGSGETVRAPWMQPQVGLPLIKTIHDKKKKQTRVELQPATQNGTIRYSLNGGTPDENSPAYAEPIQLEPGRHVLRIKEFGGPGAGPTVVHVLQMKSDK